MIIFENTNIQYLAEVKVDEHKKNYRYFRAVVISILWKVMEVF